MSIFIGSLPNNNEDDRLLAKEIVKDENFSKGSLKKLGSYFQNEYSRHEIFLFNKGREGLFTILKSINIESSDEIIVQPFTCIAVVAPILWVKAKPVYVDIELGTFNMDSEKLEESITDSTRAIILQHTFGNLVDVSKAREIVKEINSKRNKDRKIVIIEDCAHFYTTQFKVGQYSDFLLFSFAQDKALSCTQGAMIAIPKNSIYLSKFKTLYKEVRELSITEAKYNARYIILWSLIKKYYYSINIPFLHFSLGKLLLMIFRISNLIKKQASIISLNPEEAFKMSDIQATLLLAQIDRIESLNEHREHITELYLQGLKEEFRFQTNNHSLLRYPLLIDNKDQIKKELKKEKIIIGSWYTTPVFPLLESQLELAEYVKGSCPIAEHCCKNIINLPTNIEVTDEMARKIIWIINSKAIKI